MKTQRFPVVVALVFLWVGFVCAISFMEAWLKFRAPGLDMATGLQIGRLVFSALNIVEWCLAIFIAIALLVQTNISPVILASYLTLVGILLVQSLWLLPALDHRAALYISGKVPGPSHLHFYYVGFEVLKVCGLIFLGTKIPNYHERHYQLHKGEI